MDTIFCTNSIFIDTVYIKDIWNWCEEQFGMNLLKIEDYHYASWFPVYLNNKIYYVFKTDSMSVLFAIKWGGQHI